MIKNKEKFYNKILKNFDILSSDEIKRVFTQLNSLYNTQILIAENLEEGIIAIDKNNDVLFANKKSMFFLDIRMDIVGKQISECIKKQSFAYSIVDMIAAQEYEQNVMLYDKNTSRMLRINILTLGNQGRIEGALILIFDITNMWLQNQKLKRAEQLASLTTVAASVAHEIKNPLGSISIYIQLIEKMIAKLDIDKVSRLEMSDYCSIVKEEISRLEDTVNSFLFSVRSINLDLQKHDICETIYETIKFLQHEIKSSDVQVEVKSNTQNIDMVFDVKYIKQAFINIIQNSIEAMKELNISKAGNPKTIKIEINKHDSYVSISIEDNGLGIKKENIEHVFEPYFTTKYNGTGLGLTNVVRIIEAHNGSIKISSENEEGTNILIHLPIIHSEKLLS